MSSWLQDEIIRTGRGISITDRTESSVTVNGVVLYRDGPHDESGAVTGENARFEVSYNFETGAASSTLKPELNALGRFVCYRLPIILAVGGFWAVVLYAIFK